MFNNEAYQRRLDELKETIRGDLIYNAVDREQWNKDVSLRYGRFLARNTADQLSRTIMSFAAAEHVADKQKHRDYCAQELMGVVAGLHAASAMIRGAVVIADPIGAEAMMRIYEEANGTPRETAPAPMVTEADEEFRNRVLSVADAAGVDGEQRLTIVMAIGATLDEKGRKYGLLRTAAPAP